LISLTYQEAPPEGQRECGDRIPELEMEHQHHTGCYDNDDGYEGKESKPQG